MKSIFEGWTVLDKDGRIVRYTFGHGLQDIVVATKKEALDMARSLAQREDELAGDINKWEFGTMPRAQVRAMGYRVVRAEVRVRAK